MAEQVPMTRSGFKKLQDELKALDAKVLDLRKVVAAAREQGDLSENAEYHAAREALFALEDRIRSMKQRLANARLIDDDKVTGDVVTFGCAVTLADLDTGEEETFTLVGAGEEDFREGKILTTSPLGKAMLTHKVGDEFEFTAPNGTVTRYRVVKIEKA